MATLDPELRPLTEKQRKYVHLIVYQGLTKPEAFAQAHGEVINEKTKASIRNRASQLFYRPHVNNYYHALMEEIRDTEVKKGVWTKEVATQKLMRLIERAEEDIYGNPSEGVAPKQITMGRLNAIILPAKELNQMHGYNQVNLNVEGCVVQISGEEDLLD